MRNHIYRLVSWMDNVPPHGDHAVHCTIYGYGSSYYNVKWRIRENIDFHFPPLLLIWHIFLGLIYNKNRDVGVDNFCIFYYFICFNLLYCVGMQ